MAIFRLLLTASDATHLTTNLWAGMGKLWASQNMANGWRWDLTKT